MKDLLDFIQQYYGVLCGDTSANFGQCVGLIELWTDKLGLTHTWGNAKDLLNNADTSKFDVIKNDINNPNQFPLPGDILVYDSTWGLGDGHTGVVLIADGKSIILFEQNNPGAPVIKREPYRGLLGWLHPKGFNFDNQAELDEVRKQRDENWNSYQNELSLNSVLTQQNKDLTSQNDDLSKQLTACKTKLADISSQGSPINGHGAEPIASDTALQQLTSAIKQLADFLKKLLGG